MHLTRFSRVVTTTVLILAGLFGAVSAPAQVTPSLQDWMKRLASPEFSAGRGGVGRWIDGGAGYTATERNPGGVGEIVRYETATGKREILMTAAQLTPPQLGKPPAGRRVRRFRRREENVVRRQSAADHDPKNRLRLLAAR